MMDCLIILFAAFCRYTQGNGLGGEGRILLGAPMLAAAWFGPLDGHHIFWVETIPVMLMGLAGSEVAWPCERTA